MFDGLVEELIPSEVFVPFIVAVNAVPPSTDTVTVVFVE